MDTKLEHLDKRIEELNNKCTQVLVFLSFGIAAAVLLWSNKPSSMNDIQQNFVLGAMSRWIWAIFPTLLGVLPLKEISENNLRWYTFLRKFKFVVLWAAIILIFWGAVDFARAI
jgi:hypothetical protein